MSFKFFPFLEHSRCNVTTEQSSPFCSSTSNFRKAFGSSGESNSFPSLALPTHPNSYQHPPPTLPQTQTHTYRSTNIFALGLEARQIFYLVYLCMYSMFSIPLSACPRHVGLHEHLTRKQTSWQIPVYPTRHSPLWTWAPSYHLRNKLVHKVA